VSCESSVWVKAAGVSGALAIALGAFGAHGLKAKTDASMMKVSGPDFFTRTGL
jgi:uncharacterized membrane protein YgdD (TMEM256/DUF423 family)